MEVRQEKIYDKLEFESIKAMMMRAAYHSEKKLKPEDFFKRPTDKTETKETESLMEKAKAQQAWLNRFQIGKG